MKILILCTGNSCRSQMAEAILQSLDNNIKVYSAGTEPSDRVHPMAVEVMEELGLDITGAEPKPVERFLGEEFDFVVTVCGGAKESCPAFTGRVKHRLHIGFEDPAEMTGTKEEVLAGFRRVRDEILRDFFAFFHRQVNQ